MVNNITIDIRKMSILVLIMLITIRHVITNHFQHVYEIQSAKQASAVPPKGRGVWLVVLHMKAD